MPRSRLLLPLFVSLVFALCIAPGSAFADTGNDNALAAGTANANANANVGSSLRGSYALTVSTSSKTALAASGSKVAAATYKSANPKEHFYIYAEGDGIVSIQSVMTGKFLRAANGKLSFVDFVEGDQSLLWAFDKDDGLYTFKNVATGSNLSYAGGKIAASTKETSWKLRKVALIPDGTYVLVNKSRGNALSVAYSSLESGANVQLEKKTGYLNQAFAISQEDGVYKIASALSNKSLNVDGAVADSNVEVKNTKDVEAQDWAVSMDKIGGIVFKNDASGAVLNARGSGGRGVNVDVEADADSPSQVWTLETTPEKYNAAVERAASIIKDRKSKTSYYITVDKKNHWLTLFKGKKGAWVPLRAWIVSIGNSRMPTPSGDFKVGWKGKSFGEEHGYSVYYYTNFAFLKGLDFHFHSVKYYPYSNRIKDGRLGKNISWGCVRMSLVNAKYLQKTVKRNTAVKIYN